MKNNRRLLRWLVLASALAYTPWANATLGGNANTITADRKAFSAVHRATTPHNGYTVEEFVYDSTNVREYVSSIGIVFGIAWNGYVPPDLSQILGAYASEYIAAQQMSPRTHGRNGQKLVTDNIIVEKWGHMRNLRGRAYAPGLVPIEININDIK